MAVSTISPARPIAGHAASYLRQEYEANRALFEAQPPLTQRFFDAQAQGLAEAITQRLAQARFALPDQVATEAGPASLPPDQREQKVGGLPARFTQGHIGDLLRQRLTGLEQSLQPAVAVSAALVRYATAQYLVHTMLPAGRSVAYVAAEGEEIPSLPDLDLPEIGSALTAATDAIAEDDGAEKDTADAKRGELQVPYVPYARRFYLPQWVAFNHDGQLLVSSVQEAEAHLASMQRFVRVLHAAVGLAAYFVADDAYQQKRYGMLGQLINQGRALARYQTRQIIQTIQRRARAQDLNRGLSLSLPYFDDQALKPRIYPFVVIPRGRIMFVPALVVRAAREEAVKVVQDTRLSPTTRKYLLAELALLEAAFNTTQKTDKERLLRQAAY